MDNDLISREVLKENGTVIGMVNGQKMKVIPLSVIDNAPTVELFCSYLSDGEVRHPCVESPCEHERPQEEWLSNGEIFKRVFGIYATEVWSMSEDEFLKWLNQQIPQFAKGDES